MNTESKPETSKLARSWDRYWRGTDDVGAWTAGGVSHPAITAFWEDCFRQLEATADKPAMLDIATGNGALVECALRVFGDSPLDITCVDLSEAAIANIRERFPEVRGVVCDAASIPLESRSFDLVTSHFGVEYAGPKAIGVATRLLAPRGRLVLVMHNVASSIHAECTASFDALSRLRQSRFIPLASDMLRTGFAAVRGADRAPYDDAARRLQAAVDALEAIIAEHGEQVAGGSIARLYGDVARIHGRLPNYDADEVLGWLARLDDEMNDYASRMESMIAAAIDETAFRRICAGLQDSGLSLEVAAPLLAPGQEAPLAWALMAVGGEK